MRLSCLPIVVAFAVFFANGVQGKGVRHHRGGPRGLRRLGMTNSMKMEKIDKDDPYGNMASPDETDDYYFVPEAAKKDSKAAAKTKVADDKGKMMNMNMNMNMKMNMNMMNMNMNMNKDQMKQKATAKTASVEEEDYSLEELPAAPGKGEGKAKGMDKEMDDEIYSVDEDLPVPGKGKGTAQGKDKEMDDESEDEEVEIYSVDEVVDEEPEPGKGKGTAKVDDESEEEEEEEVEIYSVDEPEPGKGKGAAKVDDQSDDEGEEEEESVEDEMEEAPEADKGKGAAKVDDESEDEDEEEEESVEDEMEESPKDDKGKGEVVGEPEEEEEPVEEEEDEPANPVMPPAQSPMESEDEEPKNDKGMAIQESSKDESFNRPQEESPDDETDAPASGPTDSIVDLALATDDLSTLVDLVSAAGLVDTLATGGPFTVFAPTNDAFSALPQAAIDALFADNPEGALSYVLLYHVVEGAILAEDLSDGMVVTTLNGETVEISIGDTVMINNSTVVIPDILASNGVVHVIDAVLIPPQPDTDAPETEPPTAEGTESSTAEGTDPPTAEDTEPPTADSTATEEPETEPPIPETEPPVPETEPPVPETVPPTAIDTTEATDTPDMTDVPQTDSPDSTQAPETSEAPETTEAPDADELNDNCLNAASIDVGGDIFGSTNEAEFFGDVAGCGSAAGGDQAAPGLWYSISGSGAGLTAAVNSTYDVQLSVFAGDCEMLRCIGGNAGDEFPWTSAQFSWAGEADEMYYIYINGWEGQTGSFVLVVSEGDVPENSECSSAIPVEMGVNTGGTTEYSQIPSEDLDQCDNAATNLTTPAVWYTLTGTGEITLVSVMMAGYDSQVSIYEGESCDSLTCVATNDDSPIPGADSIVAERLEDGQTYYVLVHGFQNAFGDFSLMVETLDAAENDDCTNAVELTLGSYESGSNLASSSDDDIPFCGVGTNESSFGVWYAIEGTGGVLQVSLNDTQLLDFSIYSGESCDSLTCIDSQARALYPLDWESVAGERYLIYVYGKDRFERDSFEILVEEVERPGNDQCVDAIPLQINERATAGTTSASSTETDLEFCGEIFELGFGGVWYEFMGNGDLILVGVTADEEGIIPFDSQLSVYSGASCGELTCLDGNDQGESLGYSSAVSFTSVEGETYYVLVHGWALSRGDFTVEVRGVGRPFNDECENAITLEVFDTIPGSTFFAQSDDNHLFESCGSSKGGNFSSSGVWYGVEGTGALLEASIQATYDVQLTVFSGECGDLICVDGTEGFTTDFFSGAVLWESEEDTMYSILVHGFSGQIGEFELYVAESNRPSNDRCEDAVALEVQDTVGGSNEFADDDEVPDCEANTDPTSSMAPGVWYSFITDTIPQGDSVYSLTVLLENYTPGFQHQISILQGSSCDTLQCLAWDNSDFVSATAEWVPEANVQYYILVQGDGDSRGTFELGLNPIENVI